MAEKHVWEGMMDSFIGVSIVTESGEVDLDEAFEEFDDKNVRVTVEVLD